jgi:hypothetical protein
MLTKNSLLFAPGICATHRLALTPPFLFCPPVVHMFKLYGTTPTQVKLYFEIGLALLAFPVIA